MKIGKKLLCGAIIAAATSCPLVAQENTVAGNSSDNAKQVLESGLTRASETQVSIATGGPLDRDTAAGQPNGSLTTDFQISSVDGNTAGVIALSWGKPSSSFDDSTQGIIKYEYGRETLSAKLTVPFNDQDESPFVDFKRLGTDAQLEFVYNGYSLKGQTGPALNEQMLVIARQCLVTRGSIWQNSLAADRAGSRSKVKAVLDAYDGNSDDRYIMRVDSLRDINEFANYAISWCKPQSRIGDDGDTININVQDMIAEYGPDALGQDFRKVKNQFFGSGVTLWGLSGKAGYESYDVFNQSAFVLETEDRVGFELEGYVGKITADGNKAFRLSASYARGYDLDDPVEQCVMLSGGAEQCLSGLLMPPEKTDKFFVSFEGRLILDRNDVGQPTIAIAPMFTYDTKDEEFLVEVPLYLQQSDDGGLDAGVKVNYSSERSDIAVGLFVGVPLERLF